MKKNPLRILWLILGFAAMPNKYGRAFIVFLIIFKYVYFFTRIKTIPS